jgi:hypothetical protein
MPASQQPVEPEPDLGLDETHRGHPSLAPSADSPTQPPAAASVRTAAARVAAAKATAARTAVARRFPTAIGPVLDWVEAAEVVVPPPGRRRRKSQ